MTRCTGIITEYNPLHNGHVYHIERTKSITGGAPVIVAMSGWFVQRGDAAAFDPYTRAMWALKAGADMVIQLPVMFSMSGAERFARGGAHVLYSTGLVDKLSFGAECGNMDVISRAAELLLHEPAGYKAELASILASGKSYPSAAAEALARIIGQDDCDVLSSPNNILAIEYIQAIKRAGFDMEPVAVERTGAMHDSDEAVFGSMSASAIRNSLKSNNGNMEAIEQAVPQYVFDAIVNNNAAIMHADGLSQAVLYALRKLTKEEIADIPDVAEGLENTIYLSCRNTICFDELIKSIKTKRYTLARIRRICLNALLGITKGDYKKAETPKYIRVLGIKKASLYLMAEMAKSAKLPIVACRRDYDKLDAEARACFNKDIFAAETAQLNAPYINEFARKLIIV